MKIFRINAQDTLPLRGLVLRPGKPKSHCIFDGDELESTAHFGVTENNKILGIVSVYRRNSDKISLANGYQIRAMATDPTARGRGIGTMLLSAAEKYAFEHGAEYIWANARVGAKGFYAKAGYNVDSFEFEIAGVGPHVLIRKDRKPD